MGYHLTTSLARPSARSHASPKTHTPGSRLQERGHRFYSPGVGRWVGRDPLGEDGGDNILVLVGNDPLNAFDYLGLWRKVSGTGVSRAWYRSEHGDTVLALAHLLKLDADEYGLWMKMLYGNAPQTENEVLDGCRTVSVPNKLVIDVGNKLSYGFMRNVSLTRWLIMRLVHGRAQQAQNEGLAVEIHGDGGSVAPGFHMSDPDLLWYGYYGHGRLGAISPDYDAPVGVHHERHVHQRLALVDIIACQSYDGAVGWKKNVSTEGSLSLYRGFFPFGWEVTF